MKERLLQVRYLGTLLRIQERFGEVNGTALANGIALQTFLSLFPLLLVAIAVAGFLAAGDAGFADDVIRDLGLTGEAADNLDEALENAKDSRRAASIIGLAGLLYSGLAVVGAIQRAVDRVWQTHGEGVKDKLRALAWLVGSAVIFVGSFALSAALNVLPGFLAPLSILAGLAVNTGLFLWTFTALGRLPVGWRALLPGALVCAVGFEVLKVVGSVLIPRLVANSSALYGSLGIVVAILSWLAFFGRLLVYGAIVNVYRWEEAHGTLKVPVQVPRVDAAIALEANRSGAVTDHLTADAD